MKKERTDPDFQTSTTLSTSTSTSTIDSSDNESLLQEKPKPSLLSQIVSVINAILNKNRKSNIKLQSNTNFAFYSHKIPSISIDSYLKRIIDLALKTSSCKDNDSILISAFAYIDRLCKSKGNICLSDYNIHKIFLIAILLSIKFNNDQHYSNQSYAKIGGIPLNELNMMEHEFFGIIEYELYISDDLYKTYERYLSNISLKNTRLHVNLYGHT